MDYQGVSILNNDMYALDILAMILGQGRTSRFYKDVYEKRKLVHSISASNFTPMDKGVFEIESLLEETNVEATIQAVKTQIEEIKKQGVAESELERTKRQVLSQKIFDEQTADRVAYQMAVDEAATGDYEFSKKYVGEIKRVTSDNIKRVAQQYFYDQKLTIAILKPIHQTQSKSTKESKPIPSAIEKTVLDNGLTLLLREDHTFPIVSINIVLNGGTRQEPAQFNGLFELLARLWGAETKSKSAKQLAQIVESLGASIGGFSGRNSFGLKASFLSQDFTLGLDLIEDVVKNPTFSQEEFDRVQKALKAAITERNDEISAVTSKILRETLFLTHPFRLESLGTLESVGRITRQDIIDLYNKFVVPNNMVVSIFGDFDKTKILQSLRTKFSNWPKREVAQLNFTEDPPDHMREKTISMNKQQAMVMIGFQGPKLSDEYRDKVEVLTSILGSSLSGRMFNKIRDELGQAYTLGAGYTPGIDMGLIYFYVNTTDKEVEKVKEILLGQINELQTGEVTDEEMDHTKTYLKGTFQMDLETNDALGFTSSLDELYGLGYNHYQSYNQRIDTVTKEDLKRIAQLYLNSSKAVVVLTRPEERTKP